jgi:methyl-accepting chemotaxis protein
MSDMPRLNPRRLTREQLSAFLPTHELVRAFEKLFEVTAASPDAIDAIISTVEEVAAGTEQAIAAANSVAASVDRLAAAVQESQLAPVRHESIQPESMLTCDGVAALREQLAALERRVADLESSPGA